MVVKNIPFTKLFFTFSLNGNLLCDIDTLLLRMPQVQSEYISYYMYPPIE